MTTCVLNRFFSEENVKSLRSVFFCNTNNNVKHFYLFCKSFGSHFFGFSSLKIDCCLTTRDIC